MKVRDCDANANMGAKKQIRKLVQLLKCVRNTLHQVLENSLHLFVGPLANLLSLLGMQELKVLPKIEAVLACAGHKIWQDAR